MYKAQKERKRFMKDYIQQLIELFGHNNYSADTHKKVQQWLADEEHVDEKSEALRELWKQAGEQKVPDGMQQSIQRMRQNLGMQSITSRRNYQLLIWRAAAILLLAVSSVSIYLMLEKERPEKDLVECYIPTAEIRELTLPDGTYVMLNSKSILLYPEKFTGETRSVYLIGEANFKVKPDKKHPFIVKANDYQVTALGTEFNVNAYPDEKVVATTLVEGKVRVGYGSKNFDLDPGMQFVYDREDKTANVRTVDMELYTSWKDGYYYFKQESLERIMDVLAKWYNLNVFFQNPELKNMEFGGRLKRYEDISYLLEKMEETQDVQFIIHGNTIIIKRKTD